MTNARWHRDPLGVAGSSAREAAQCWRRLPIDKYAILYTDMLIYERKL